MISLYCWNQSLKQGCWDDNPTLNSRLEIPEGEIWWIDLNQPTPEEDELVFRNFFPVHPLTLEDITKQRREPDRGPHFPKVEEFPDYLFAIVDPLRPAALPEIEQSAHCTGTNTQLSAVLDRRVLITHHYDDLPSIQGIRQYLGRHSEIAGRGPDYLFHLILDAMVDEYAPEIDRLADRFDEIETSIYDRPTNAVLAELIGLKRRVVALRKTLILEREVLARLIRGEFDLVDEREIVYYRNVFDHLVRYTELIESSREMVSDLMQTHLAAMSNRMNGIMKVLTMISTIVLPMTLIAGVYGMNFEHIPELKWNWGYPFALSLMIASASFSVGLFYWKKWL